MQDVKPIVTVCEYGKIEIRLRALMEERGLSRNQLAKLTGTRFEVINKWFAGSVERIDADVLARLCYVLNCDAGELIRYVP